MADNLASVSSPLKQKYWLRLQILSIVFDLITIHNPISAQSSNFVVFRLHLMYLYLLIYKSICCGQSFELPQQVEAIQMCTHNIRRHKMTHKGWRVVKPQHNQSEVPTTYAFIKTISNEYYLSIINNLFMKSFANFSLKCGLIRCIFS